MYKCKCASLHCDRPMSSANYIIFTTDIGTLWHCLLFGLQIWTVSIACVNCNSPFFIPPGTHYCWVGGQWSHWMSCMLRTSTYHRWDENQMQDLWSWGKCSNRLKPYAPKMNEARSYLRASWLNYGWVETEYVWTKLQAILQDPISCRMGRNICASQGQVTIIPCQGHICLLYAEFYIYCRTNITMFTM